MPSHYLHQWWDIVNWTSRNTFQWQFNQNPYILIHKNAFEMSGKWRPFYLGFSMLHIHTFFPLTFILADIATHIIQSNGYLIDWFPVWSSSVSLSVLYIGEPAITLALSQWSSSGNPVAIQCAWNLDPSAHWNATGERIVGSQCDSSGLPVVFQWLSSGLPVCSNYANKQA